MTRATSQNPSGLFVVTGIPTPLADDWDKVLSNMSTIDAMFQGNAAAQSTGSPTSLLNAPQPVTNTQMPWVSGTAYGIGVLVTYSGTIYQSINAVTSTTNPATDTTNWRALPWVSGQATFLGEIVSYSGRYYQCIQAASSGTGTTVTPLADAAGNSGTYWWDLSATGTPLGNNPYFGSLIVGANPVNLTTVPTPCAPFAGAGYSGYVVQTYLAGKYNTFVGAQAGTNVTASSYNTLVGYQAGALLTDGEQNTAIGGGAGYYLRHGYHNTFVGCGAGQGNVDGWYNVAIGCDNGLQIESTASTASLGTCSIAANGTVTVNNQLVAGQPVKFSGGTLPTNMSASTIYWVLTATSTTFTFSDTYTHYLASTAFTPSGASSGSVVCYPVPNNNVSIGTSIYGWSGQANLGIGGASGTGNCNVAVGMGTAGSLTTGSNNMMLGQNAGNRITTGSYNISVLSTGPSTGTNNIAIGYQSAANLSSGTQNVFVGNGAGGSVTTTSYNIGIGYNACGGTGANPTGIQCNVFIGYNSGASVANGGADNVGIGHEALQNLTTGTLNTAVGYLALGASTADNYNTAIGYEAGYSLNGGSQNAFLGGGSGFHNVTGSYNTYVGQGAGQTNATNCSHCTFVGQGADTNSSVPTATNSTALGSGATITASNQIVLGNASVTKVNIPGVAGLPSGTLASPPSVNIGDLWLDTTGGGTVHPILRIRLS